MEGPGEAALTILRRAVDLLRPLGASSLLGVALNNLGEVYYGARRPGFGREVL